MAGFLFSSESDVSADSGEVSLQTKQETTPPDNTHEESVPVPSLIEQTKQDIIEESEDSDDLVDGDEEEVVSEGDGDYEGDDLGEPSYEPHVPRQGDIKNTAWYQRIFDNFLPRSAGWCGRWI